jgi:carbamoyl-phosphate synthase large subunit
LKQETLQELKKQTKIIALGLKVKGLVNIQFAIKDNDIYILEVNPRASRTVPFVAKATGVPIAKIASLVMSGEKLKKLVDIEKIEQKIFGMDRYAVKEVVFPFNKFSLSDVILGPEMKSTGEAMGIDKNFSIAYAKAQMGCNNNLPKSGNVFISVKDCDKESMISLATTLKNIGFNLVATGGTQKYLQDNGIEVDRINKVQEGSPHIVDMILEGNIAMIINTTEGEKSIEDSFSIRRSAILMKVPYTTTSSGAREIVRSLKELNSDQEITVEPIQNF